jgi:hypothetical protein
MIPDISPACDPLKLQPAEHGRIPYLLKVDRSVKLEDVTSPKFWRHIKHLNVDDEITIVSPILDVLLRVIVSGDGLTVTRTLRIWEEPQAEVKAAEAVKGRTAFIPGKGWRALRPDGTEISAGHASKAEAQTAIEAAA